MSQITFGENRAGITLLRGSYRSARWAAIRDLWPAAGKALEPPTIENYVSALYNLGRKPLSRAPSNPAPDSQFRPKPRRWSIIGAGLLLVALALVVLYTTRSAFTSPLALVVVATIGIAALLLQLLLRKGPSVAQRARVRAPLWLNAIGVVFAIAAVVADIMRLSANFMLVAALGSVVCFAVSGIAILRALRKNTL
jgi:hypothetical protein